MKPSRTSRDNCFGVELLGRHPSRRRAFSLAEMLIALVIGSMVLIAVLTIYSRAESSSAAIHRQFDQWRTPQDVLQLIAEDLDMIVGASADIRIAIKSGADELYATSRLEITKNLYNRDNNPVVFEQIIWQANYDSQTGNGLVLYRSHSGLKPEDKLLDSKRKDYEKDYSFVPICTGITYFSVQVPINEEEYLDTWTSEGLPKALLITISFAEPYKSPTGGLEVDESDKVFRTMAIDRTRKIKFVLSKTANQDERSKSAEQQDREQAEGEQVEGEQAESQGPVLPPKVPGPPPSIPQLRKR